MSIHREKAIQGCEGRHLRLRRSFVPSAHSRRNCAPWETCPLRSTGREEPAKVGERTTDEVIQRRRTENVFAICYQMLPSQKKRALQVVEKMVDLTGIEPVTSSMPWKRAPSCATGPLFEGHDYELSVADNYKYSRRPREDSQRDLSAVVRGSICLMCRGSRALTGGVRREQPLRAQRRVEFASNRSG